MMVEADNGGARYNKGKPRLDLIPPDVLIEWARVCTHGAEKYGREAGGARNWERGMPWGVVYSCAQHHLDLWWAGERCEDESGLPHLAHALWNIGALLAYELRGIGTDDRQILKPGTRVPTGGT